METVDSRSESEMNGEVFCNILDNISDQIKARFYHFGEQAFLGLVDCAKFCEMSQHFDVEHETAEPVKIRQVL